MSQYCVRAIIRCFSFYCSGAHRDLHSFPTRRSSDLTDFAGLARGAGIQRTYTFAALEDWKAGAAQALSGPGPVVVGLDRKSTRLNSSHVAISYAVFCLKKKNTKIHNNWSTTHRAHRQ